MNDIRQMKQMARVFLSNPHDYRPLRGAICYCSDMISIILKKAHLVKRWQNAIRSLRGRSDGLADGISRASDTEGSLLYPACSQ